VSAIFWVKFVHTIIFLVESAAILYILYSALFDPDAPGLLIAVILVLAEVVVFVANGTRCPLTKLARDLGDTTGNDFVADIFLPPQFARMIPFVCGGLAGIGLLTLGLRLLLR
jgi:hypothetical protein